MVFKKNPEFYLGIPTNHENKYTVLHRFIRSGSVPLQNHPFCSPASAGWVFEEINARGVLR